MNHYSSHHMKRTRSPVDNNSDSCDDDAFSEEMCAVTGSTTITGGGSTRKRRRGVIEKRRRDRINCSLNELKRLVPTALEKSASAKLEKAEILQMTVEHLKTIETTRGKTDLTSGDPNSHRFAMDYHGFGFRECAAEVARYLSSVEGLDSQDPLRLRLMSHLQIFAAQRGVVASTPPPPPPPPQPHQPVAAPYHQAHTQQHNPETHHWPHYGSGNGYDPAAGKINTALGPGYEHISAAAANPAAGFFDYFGSPPTSTSSPSSSRPSSHYTPSLSTSSSSPFSPLSSSVSSSSPSPLFSSANGGYAPPAPPTAATPAKPYRPWGAEMAC